MRNAYALSKKNMDRRRGQILEAARSIIIESGVAALSVRALADKSGLVVKTLYNLFGSKENILVALIEQGTAEVDAAIASAAQSTDNFAQSMVDLENIVVRNAPVLKPAMLASLHFAGARDSDAMAMHNRRIEAVSGAITLAIENKLIAANFPADKVAWVLYRSYVEAVSDWAYGIHNDAEFKVHARVKLLSVLHGFVTPEVLPLVDKSLQINLDKFSV